MEIRRNETTYEQRLIAMIATETDLARKEVLQRQLEDERLELSQILSPLCDMGGVCAADLPPK